MTRNGWHYESDREETSWARRRTRRLIVLGVSDSAAARRHRRRSCASCRATATRRPPTARRGINSHLLQYPAVSLATPRERARAQLVLDRLEGAQMRGNWRDVRSATRAGYDTRSRPRKTGDASVFFFHAERHEEPRGRSIFDFTRPKALIYANAPGRPLVLVGAMWSTRDGEVGPTPAGPILRWHSHVVCKAGKKRGLKPPAGGVCPQARG